MDSLACYNLAIEQLNAASHKEVAKRYGEAKESYEKAIEYFIGALHREPAHVFKFFESHFVVFSMH